jgi:hypothetical protein
LLLGFDGASLGNEITQRRTFISQKKFNRRLRMPESRLLKRISGSREKEGTRAGQNGVTNRSLEYCGHQIEEYRQGVHHTREK